MSETKQGEVAGPTQDRGYQIMTQQNQERFKWVAKQRAEQEERKKELYKMVRRRAAAQY